MWRWRFAIAGFCFVGTYEAWSKPQFWVYFTFQTGFVLGIVMLWAGAATLLKGIQPPAWLKGCLTLYAIVTALVAFFLMPPDNPALCATGYWHHDQYDAAQKRPDYGGYRFRAIRPASAFPLALHVLVAGVLPCILGRSCWPVRRFGRVPDPRPAVVRIRTTSSTWTRSAGKGSALAVASWRIAFLVISLVVWLLDRALPNKALLG